jgi:hypothetical protein
MGSRTLKEFLMRFMKDLKKICGIDNDILRNKLSTILEYCVNSIMNEFIKNYCVNSNLNEFIENGRKRLEDLVNKTRSNILKSLRDCSFEGDKDKRNKLQNRFLEVIQSKLDIINQKSSLREYNESLMKKIRLSSPYALNSSNSERKKRDDNIDFIINFFKIKEHEEIYWLEHNKIKNKDRRLLIRCRCGTECNPDNNHYWQAEAESNRALEIVYFYNNLNGNDNDFTVIEHLVEIIKSGKAVYIYKGILTPLNQLLVIIISRFKNKINLMSQSDKESYKNCVNFIDKYIDTLINKSSEIRQSQRDFAHELENHDYSDICTPIDPTHITIISILENESSNESNPYEIDYGSICTTIEPANYITYGKRNRPCKLSSSSSKDSMIP